MLIPVVLAAALMNAAMVAASAVSTILVADELAPGVAGLPNAAGVLGTAAGAVAVGRGTARWGRATALRLGYLAAVGGGALTLLASISWPVGWLFVGMLLLGAGNAAALLSRYAAADAVPPSRRAAAMSAVVWAATAGAVGGPFLLEPARVAAVSAGLPPLSGAFLLATLTASGAVFAASRIRTHQRAAEPELDMVDAGRPFSPRRTTVVVAAAVMLVGQLVMVALMTAVPVHAHHQGHGLGQLGLMLSAHTLGMFALSPVTGWWIDRNGPRPVMLAGLATLVVSALVIAGPADLTFTPALFVLGYGWNLCYLSGSSLLTRAGAAMGSERARLESTVEAWVWGVSALATAVSTWLFAEGGFPLLSTVGIGLALPLLAVVASRRVVPVDADRVQAVQQTCG